MSKQTVEKIDPALLLTETENKARQVAYEQSMGAAATFVAKLIEAGRLQTIGAAVTAFNEGVAALQTKLQADLVAMQMKSYEAYLIADKPEAKTNA